MRKSSIFRVSQGYTSYCCVGFVNETYSITIFDLPLFCFKGCCFFEDWAHAGSYKEKKANTDIYRDKTTAFLIFASHSEVLIYPAGGPFP